jgi:8-oxo-dGTP diphosphatase
MSSSPNPGDPHNVHGSDPAKPYRIACLCDLRDKDGRVLLLHRAKEPNKGLCSPIGGKLDVFRGESPAQCARREIMEEAGLDVPIERLHLVGLVSECEFEGRGHWLMFIYRVLGPVWVEPREMDEGRLDWFRPEEINALPIPDSDRRIIWPLMRRAEDRSGSEVGNAKGETQQRTASGEPGRGAPLPTPHSTLASRPGFFAVHIDCRRGGMEWQVEQET